MTSIRKANNYRLLVQVCSVNQLYIPEVVKRKCPFPTKEDTIYVNV